jgi:hypothetical protein
MAIYAHFVCRKVVCFSKRANRKVVFPRRNSSRLRALCLSVSAFIGVANAGAPACSAHSVDVARPLVELFTSEGCSSCPPADTWLSQQREKVRSGELSAVAWHVDYWDSLGWKDPFSIPQASPRQRWLAGLDRAQVYTPGVFLNGREWRGYRGGALAASSTAAPSLDIQATRSGTGFVLQVAVAQLPENATLYVVPQLFNRQSAVTRGENSGRTLKHDFSASGVQSQKLTAGARAQSATLALNLAASDAVTVFVQADSGAVLQSAQLWPAKGFASECGAN